MGHLSFVKFNVVILFFMSLIAGNPLTLAASLLIWTLLHTRPTR